MSMTDALEPCPDCGSLHHKSCAQPADSPEGREEFMLLAPHTLAGEPYPPKFSSAAQPAQPEPHIPDDTVLVDEAWERYRQYRKEWLRSGKSIPYEAWMEAELAALKERLKQAHEANRINSDEWRQRVESLKAQLAQVERESAIYKPVPKIDIGGTL